MLRLKIGFEIIGIKVNNAPILLVRRPAMAKHGSRGQAILGLRRQEPGIMAGLIAGEKAMAYPCKNVIPLFRG